MANENLVVAKFYIHSVQNPKKSAEAGRPIYDDIEVCEIRFAANKQTVHVAPAHEVFRTARNFATGEVTPITYALEYKEQYLKFKNEEAQDQSGTPLAELPFLTQSKRLELKALNIHTAETLASLDGTPLKQLGMGGRELKAQAQAYLDKAAGSVDVVALAAQVAALQADNERLRGATVSVAGDLPPSPFADWEADDLKNWIEQNTGERPKGNPNVATLIKRADQVNADLAAKAKAKDAA